MLAAPIVEDLPAADTEDAPGAANEADSHHDADGPDAADRADATDAPGGADAADATAAASAPTATASDYALLDLGSGRQLARFGEFVVDRPFPAATGVPLGPAGWSAADLRYDRLWSGAGEWTAVADTVPSSWPLRHDGLTFELRPTPAGQVGFFAEQIEPWRWLRSAIAGRPLDVLNLFAYTGGSTLAAAASGAHVTHVDASRSAVAWARRNAELSGLSAAPVRWIVDDVLAFVGREARRGRTYQGLILDPPSYGHGPHGERWTLADDLPGLLDACLGLTPEPAFVLLTAHAEGLRAEDLAAELAAAFVRAGRHGDAARIEHRDLTVHASSGASAAAGVSARWRSRETRAASVPSTR